MATRASKVTANALQGLKPRAWLTCGGGLEARRSKGGAVLLYFRWRPAAGGQERYPLGRWTLRNPGAGLDVAGLCEAHARRVLTLEQARNFCALVLLPRTAEADRLGLTLTELLAREDAARKAAEAERIRAEATASRTETQTLGALLRAYTNELVRLGKVTAGQVEARVARQLLDAHPDLCAKPANAVTPEDIVGVLRPLVAAGKVRAAGFVRAYVHAAYGLALRASLDPMSPSGATGFEIASNPASSVKAIPIATRSRALNEAELRDYLARVEALPDGPTRAGLLVALRLGGQRITQTLRLTLADLDEVAGTVTLRDPKGRRTTPREHVLPAPAEVFGLLEPLAERARTKGRADLFHRTRQGTLSHAVRAISQAMVEAGTANAPFVLADVRRTCETLLASVGVSKDVRAQLLSHGLGGLQGQRYDRHSYLNEKRAALVAWNDFLSNGRPVGNVVMLAR